MARKENPFGPAEGAGAPGFPSSPGAGLIKASASPGKIPRIPGMPRATKAPKVPKIPKPKIPRKVTN
jgi:hypothetical protein